MAVTSTIASTESTITRGIAFSIASYAAFSTADALVKAASAGHSVFQVALTLSLFAMLPVLFLTRGVGGLPALFPKRWGLVVARGILTAFCGLCAWQAFAMLPLADGYAILFLAPIMVTAISALFLGEEVGWRRWSAAAAGFVGVIIMVRPDFATIGVGHGLALLAAVLGAVSFCVLKRIGSSETSASILFVLFLSIIIVAAPGALTTWITPGPSALLTMALAGLLMGTGQAALVLATREAPAVVVAPFQYSQMIWAVVLGVVFFGDRPTPMLFLGMGIVVASGLFTLWRETVRRGKVTIGTRVEVPARAAR